MKGSFKNLIVWVTIVAFTALVFWAGSSSRPSVAVHDPEPPDCPADCPYRKMRGDSDALDRHERVDQVTRSYCPLHSPDSPKRAP